MFGLERTSVARKRDLPRWYGLWSDWDYFCGGFFILVTKLFQKSLARVSPVGFFQHGEGPPETLPEAFTRITPLAQPIIRAPAEKTLEKPLFL